MIQVRPGITPDPFQTNPDIGPIDPTQLRYRAPILTPSQYVDIDPDTNPIAIGPDAKFIDETNVKQIVTLSSAQPLAVIVKGNAK